MKSLLAQNTSLERIDPKKFFEQLKKDPGASFNEKSSSFHFCVSVHFICGPNVKTIEVQGGGSQVIVAGSSFSIPPQNALPKVLFDSPHLSVSGGASQVFLQLLSAESIQNIYVGGGSSRVITFLSPDELHSLYVVGGSAGIKIIGYRPLKFNSDRTVVEGKRGRFVVDGCNARISMISQETFETNSDTLVLPHSLSNYQIND